MIPYGRQWIGEDDVAAVEEVLNSDWLTQGPNVLEFEKALAKYCDSKYAVAVSHGTAALHLAYLVAGLEAGDEAITTANTFAATANMLLAVGARPVFCDIRLDTYNLDESKIEKLITKKTRVIVPVHFAGQSCAVEEILKIAKKYDLVVIEDACHALGAKFKNKKIGSLNSDMTILSFHPVKSITTGEGGAILTNNTIYYQKLISLRSHGIHKDQQGKNLMTELGYNYRLTDIQAALGRSQLKKIDHFIKKRRTVVRWYEQFLRGIKEVILPKELEQNYSSWHLYVIRTVNSKARDILATYLKKKGIGVNFHYPAVYAHPYYRRIGFSGIRLKNMEEYQRSCLTLPCYPQLTRAEVFRVSQFIKDFFKK